MSPAEHPSRPGENTGGDFQPDPLPSSQKEANGFCRKAALQLLFATNKQTKHSPKLLILRYHEEIGQQNVFHSTPLLGDQR